MATFRTADGVRIHYDDRGNGRPLVLVHGWMMSGAVWNRQVDAFAARARVIVPDIRGCGRSETRAGTDEMPRYAEDLHGLLETLDLRRATLVGWSMGGGIIMEYLARHGTTRTAAVGLIDFPPRLEEDPSVADKVCHNLFSRKDSFAQGFIRRMFLKPPPAEEERRILSITQECLAPVACDMYRAMRGTGPPLAMKRYDLPALLAFPRQGWFPGALAQWREWFPTNIVPTLDASKHCPFLEEPAIFNDALGKLLDRVT